jgi:hypothetical protein
MVFIVILLAPPLVFSQTKIEHATGLCSKASGISKGLSEVIATRMKTSVSTIVFRRGADGMFPYLCEATVDTANGPEKCQGSLFTDGKGVYWIGSSSCL